MFSIADVLTIHLLGNSKMDISDQMRVSMFCLSCESVANKNILLPKEGFIENFIFNIKETTGYTSLNSFCVITEDALTDIAERCYNVIELNKKGYYSEGKDVYYGRVVFIDIVLNSEGQIVQETIEKDNLQIIISYDSQNRVIKEQISNGETYDYIFNKTSFVIVYSINGVEQSIDTYNY